MEEPRFDPLDYVSAFSRRKWWFLVPVGLAIIVGVALVFLLPRSYEAATIVTVRGSRLAPNVVSTAVMDKQERLRAVSQQLLSRTVLERTARLEHLDRKGSLEAAVGRLRGSISVSVPDGITPGSATSSQLSPEEKAQLDNYQITYTDSSPEDAQRIVNRLAQVFVEENNKLRDVRAQDTSQFIEGQLQQSEQRLSTLEEKLRETKEAYMGRLPEQTNANLAMVTTLQHQLDANTTSIRGEQDKLALTERQLESIEQDVTGAIAGPGAPGTAQTSLAQLRRDLAAAQLTYTDKHPEVVRLKEEIAAAEKLAAVERTRPASDRAATLQANPEYRQLAKDRDATKLRIADLQRQNAAIIAQIKNYQDRVEAAPRVQEQLVAVQRQYDLERSTYTELNQKRHAAVLEEEMQMKQAGEQFAVLVPASQPDQPVKPKPLQVLLMSIAAGFMLGGAGLVGREYLDRSVHDARGLRDEFELPVLAEIPRIGPVAS